MKISLLNISDNRRYTNCPAHSEAYHRDRAFLLFDDNGSWEFKLNDEVFNGDSISQLGEIFKQLHEAVKVKKRRPIVKKYGKDKTPMELTPYLVIWTDRLPQFEDVIRYALYKQGLQDTKRTQFIDTAGNRFIMEAKSEYLEFRSFNVLAGDKLSKIKETYHYEEKGIGVMERYLDQYKDKEGRINWQKVRWTAAHMFEKNFTQRLETNIAIQPNSQELSRLLHYEIKSRPALDLYNTYIYKGNKAGLMMLNPSCLGKTQNTIYDFDISQAYGGQFVRANDFPIGHIKLSSKPFSELSKLPWYAVILEFSEKPKCLLPWITEYIYENNSYRVLLTKVDFDCLELWYGENWREAIPTSYIYKSFECKKVGYLNESIRSTIVGLYNERQRLKNVDEFSDYDPEEQVLKKILEIAYGKGLQKRDTTFRYFSPQISYHACQKARYEVSLMLKRLGWSFVSVDTDGIKSKQSPSFFKQRNEEIRQELLQAGFPNTNIGTWKIEGCYPRFIQFANKVYCYETENGGYTTKFAGCSKQAAAEWIEELGDIEGLLQYPQIPDGTHKYQLNFRDEDHYVVDIQYFPYELPYFNKRKEIKLYKTA